MGILRRRRSEEGYNLLFFPFIFLEGEIGEYGEAKEKSEDNYGGSLVDILCLQFSYVTYVNATEYGNH